MPQHDRLVAALEATRSRRSAIPSRDLPTTAAAAEADLASELMNRGVDACILGDDNYPKQLATVKRAPTVLFLMGNHDLLPSRSVGMCGSRNASEAGLRAASACGQEVAVRGLTIISGYAKGVDTQTHLAALENGGATVIVLAEGISHFHAKRSFAATGLPLDRVLVVSQFNPRQRWSVGGAMTRNSVIAGLAQVLVVIEAGAKGGTLNAGLRALEMGRPVVALEFTTGATPEGNEILFEKGASRVRSRQDLGRLLEEIDAHQGAPLGVSQQLPFL